MPRKGGKAARTGGKARKKDGKKYKDLEKGERSGRGRSGSGRRHANGPRVCEREVRLPKPYVVKRQ